MTRGRRFLSFGPQPRRRIVRLARGFSLVAALALCSCSEEGGALPRPMRRAGPAHSAEAHRPGVPYLFLELIECRGSVPFQVAAAVTGRLLRQPAAGGTVQYTFLPEEMASMVAGQDEPAAFPVQVLPTLVLRRDARTRLFTFASRPVEAAANVASELFVRGERGAGGRGGRVHVPLFPPNNAGLPASVPVDFEVIDHDTPTGPLRVVFWRSEVLNVPLSPEAQDKAAAMFRGAAVFDPKTRTLQQATWEFEAWKGGVYGEGDQLIQKAAIVRTDGWGKGQPELLGGRGKGVSGLAPASDHTAPAVSSEQPPKWCAAALWTARVAYLSTAIQAEGDTNPLPVLAILGAVSVIDWAVDWGTNIASDIRDGRPINPLDDDGFSFITWTVRQFTDRAGIDPKWGNLIATGTKILMSVGATTPLAPATAPKLHLVVGGHMAHASQAVKNLLRFGLDLERATRPLRKASTVVAAVRELAELARPAPAAQTIGPSPQREGGTTTVLVVDVSGSMNGVYRGSRKLDAAKTAAQALLAMIQHEADIGTELHRVGLVTFATKADVVVPVAADLSAVRSGVERLAPGGNTNLGDGLVTALRQLKGEKIGQRRVIVLLSDGCSNCGLPAGAILSGPVHEAASAGISIYAVGFGEGREIDQELLKAVAERTGGEYALATAPARLYRFYIRSRHKAVGKIVVERTGIIRQDETVKLGTFAVPPGQKTLHATLQWPGSALDLKLLDPAGRCVDEKYPRASIRTQKGMLYCIVKAPLAGTWRAEVTGRDVPEPYIPYNVIISVRQPSAPSVVSLDWPLVIAVMAVLLTAFYGGALLGFLLLLGRQRADMSARHTGPWLIGSDRVVYPLVWSATTIGRAPDNHIPIAADERVSWRHARITRTDDGHYVLTDHSTNGTLVNQRLYRGTSTTLAEGDVITLGGYSLTFTFSRGASGYPTPAREA